MDDSDDIDAFKTGMLEIMAGLPHEARATYAIVSIWSAEHSVNPTRALSTFVSLFMQIWAQVDNEMRAEYAKGMGAVMDIVKGTLFEDPEDFMSFLKKKRSVKVTAHNIFKDIKIKRRGKDK